MFPQKELPLLLCQILIYLILNMYAQLIDLSLAHSYREHDFCPFSQVRSGKHCHPFGVAQTQCIGQQINLSCRIGIRKHRHFNLLGEVVEKRYQFGEFGQNQFHCCGNFHLIILRLRHGRINRVEKAALIFADAFEHNTSQSANQQPYRSVRKVKNLGYTGKNPGLEYFPVKKVSLGKLSIGYFHSTDYAACGNFREYADLSVAQHYLMQHGYLTGIFHQKRTHHKRIGDNIYAVEQRNLHIGGKIADLGGDIAGYNYIIIFTVGHFSFPLNKLKTHIFRAESLPRQYCNASAAR